MAKKLGHNLLHNQTENKLGLKIHTHQIKEAIKNTAKKEKNRGLVCQLKLH